ncbi:hypothetical protein [Sphingomonas sp.]|jgi:hypothetical protein|uniref:hypothetical protein n=1 Tax=Sphingomonas sp. TaxID=28214 RepID=UPI0035C7D0B7
MNHVAIIKALGGAASVAAELRARGLIVADVTARSWTLADRSIPSKYWAHLVAVGSAKGVEVSFEQLARAVAARPITSAQRAQAAA